MSSKGSNKAKCQRYRQYAVRQTNKRRKLTKHLLKFPNDKDAEKALSLI